MPLYRLKKGTYATGNNIDGNLRVVRAKNKDDNVIDHPDETLATKEPGRYERVEGHSNFSSRQGEEYNLPNDPDQIEAEARRLNELAARMRKQKDSPSASQAQQAQQQQHDKDDDKKDDGPKLGVHQQKDSESLVPNVPRKADHGKR